MTAGLLLVEMIGAFWAAYLVAAFATGVAQVDRWTQVRRDKEPARFARILRWQCGTFALAIVVSACFLA